MKTITVALLLAAAPVLARPALTKGDATWVVTNQHLRLTFDKAAGGWLTQVAGADGKVWIQSGFGYSDHGLFADGHFVGSSHERQATLQADERGDELTVTASGRPRPAPNDPIPADGLAYELAVTVGDGRDVKVAVRWRSLVDRPSVRGFMAAVWTLPNITEWYADTVDGRINELAGSDRGYQSANWPLDPQRARLGLVYRDGRRLELLDPRPAAGPLMNVFSHHGGGGAALFLAMLDGSQALPWPAGRPWETVATLRLVP